MKLADLALTEEGAAVGAEPALRDLAGHADAGGVGEARQLGERLGGLVRIAPRLDHLSQDHPLDRRCLVQFHVFRRSQPLRQPSIVRDACS